MIGRMSTLPPAGPRGPVGSGLPTAARAADPAVAACWRALPAVAARPRPGTPVTDTPVTGVLEIDVFGTPAFDAPGTSGYPQQAGKRTAFEHNGTTLGIHSPGRPSS